METPEKKKPAHEVKLGKIRATIWANETDQDVWFNVTLTRRYHDGESWKDTTSFRRDDLPVAAKAADMAYAWIWNQHTVPDSGETEL